MGIDYGLLWKRGLLAADREIEKQGIVPVRNDCGRVWRASGDDNCSNPEYHGGDVKAVIVDLELWIHTIPEDPFGVPYLRASVLRFISPFIGEDGMLKLILVLLFDNSKYKPLNKAETSLARAEVNREFVLPDDEVPTELPSAFLFPGRKSVLATPLYKQMFYNTVMGIIYDVTKGLKLATPTCGVVVAAPWAVHEKYRVENTSVFDPDDPPVHTPLSQVFFLTGDHYVFPSHSELDVTEAKSYWYGEADLIMRVYCDFLQREYPHLFDSPGARIVVKTKDSDSIPIFLASAPPGPVTLALGTISLDWLRTYEYVGERDEETPSASKSKAKGENRAFFIDMDELYDAMGMHDPLRRATFALACALSGTDYVSRPEGIGAASLYGGFGSWRSAQLERHDKRSLHTFTPGVYRAHTNGALVLQKDQAIQCITKAWRTNKPACLAFTKNNNYLFLRATWQILYWMMADAKRGGPDPLKFGWRPRLQGEPPGFWPIIDGEPPKKIPLELVPVSAATRAPQTPPQKDAGAGAAAETKKKQAATPTFTRRPAPAIPTSVGARLEITPIDPNAPKVRHVQTTLNFAHGPGFSRAVQGEAKKAVRMVVDEVESVDSASDEEVSRAKTLMPLSRESKARHHRRVSSDVEEIPGTPPTGRPKVLSYDEDTDHVEIPETPLKRPPVAPKRVFDVDGASSRQDPASTRAAPQATSPPARRALAPEKKKMKEADPPSPVSEWDLFQFHQAKTRRELDSESRSASVMHGWLSKTVHPRADTSSRERTDSDPKRFIGGRGGW
jgi:hypothetical protein